MTLVPTSKASGTHPVPGWTQHGIYHRVTRIQGRLITFTMYTVPYFLVYYSSFVPAKQRGSLCPPCRIDLRESWMACPSGATSSVLYSESLCRYYRDTGKTLLNHIHFVLLNKSWWEDTKVPATAHTSREIQDGDWCLAQDYK